MGRTDKIEKNRQGILSILAEKKQTLTSLQISELLQGKGLDISERSVRLYLTKLDDEGLTIAEGKKGRRISDSGLEELKAGQLMDRVGYMSTKIDNLTYGMSFDLALRTGTVVINTAIVEEAVLLEYWDQIHSVFEQGYAMGDLISLLFPGESVGAITIPPGKIGLCTVCSVTLNGVLLKHGIPTRSIFSGLLELEEGKAKRFAEIINYDGTSMDPLQLFIRARLTNYTGAIQSGNGKIGAGFREIPLDSHDLSCSLAEKLKTIGLGAFLQIGDPSKDLLNIPVHEGSCGVIVIGGLNPVAILEENMAEVSHFALSGLMEYNKLFHYGELKKRMIR